MRRKAIVARKAMRVASALLVAGGLGALLVLNASDWYAQYLADRNISAYAARCADYDDPERQECLEQAHLYNERIAGSDPDAAIWPYGRQLHYRGEPMMGYIEIPKIAVRLPIYHGTAEAELMSGAGHLEGSSLPVGGLETRCVLLGHSGMANTRMFDDVRKLRNGDVFVIWTLDEPHAYEVYDTLTVLPDQVRSYIGVKHGEDLATLVTCTPYGINSHRLLVQGKRCVYDPQAAAESAMVTSCANARSVPLAIAVLMVVLSACAALARRAMRRRRQAERHFKRVLGGATGRGGTRAHPAHARDAPHGVVQCRRYQ